MIISKDLDELRKAISNLKKDNPNKSIGFVPTMGALHQGHLSLVEKASEHTDIVIVSVFVNPTQFNDSSDLEKYPRTLQSDTEKLRQTACDILFAPNEKVVYPNGPKPYEINLGFVGKTMEGKFRKGHFEGVCMVVERLFEMVKPDKAFFGLKDFQQVAVIKKMVELRSIPVEIIPVEIVRSDKGLALSSRNALLSEQQKEDALIIHQTLLLGKSLVTDGCNPAEIKKEMIRFFN